MHAITAANNLLSAMIDNHIHQGNELQIDLRQLSWTRVLDMNDRALRNVTVALGGKVCGFPREDHFMITVASEIMAILCLAKDLEDLKERFGRIVIGCNLAGDPVYVHQLGCQGGNGASQKDAIKPNSYKHWNIHQLLFTVVPLQISLMVANSIASHKTRT